MNLHVSRCLALSLALLIPSTLFAAEVSVESDTIVRIEQRDVTGGSKEDLIPATQYLGLDAKKLWDGNLSLHMYGWGRADMGDESYDNSKTAGNLTYGYLLYRFNKDAADIRAGRFFVREGIVNEQVDGLSARANLPYGFAISAFGGATVHVHDLYGENTDGKGDSVFGGRLSYKYRKFLELGVSGVYESDAPTLDNHVNGDNRKVGADIWLSPIRSIELVGHSSYSTEADEIAEHRYMLNLRPVADLTISGQYNYQKEQGLLYSWAMFSGAAVPSGDKATNTGVTATYNLSKSAELSLDYNHYDREVGNADRYGGDLKLSFLGNTLKSGLGYHYLDAGQEFAISGTASGSYQNLRAYIMHDTKGYFAAIEGIGYFFKEKINNEDNAIQASMSLGYHLTPALALSGDISYGQNPDFNDETKGLIRLTYNMTFDSIGGKK
jgi:hypothetical protein